IEEMKLSWCNSSEKTPFEGMEELKLYWDIPGNDKMEWVALDGMFWICGKQAYTRLPKKWQGTCTIGIIEPGFFLLPKDQRKMLGIPL
ncbi:ENR1 protein, partial [Podilymbus podiceps]|nr:ENR1 protein [Podilymbus podiceps]